MLPRGAETEFLGTVLGSKMGPILDPKTIKKSVQDQLETNTRKVTDKLYKLPPSGRSKNVKKYRKVIQNQGFEVYRKLAKPINTSCQNRAKSDPKSSKTRPKMRHEGGGTICGTSRAVPPGRGLGRVID